MDPEPPSTPIVTSLAAIEEALEKVAAAVEEGAERRNIGAPYMVLDE